MHSVSRPQQKIPSRLEPRYSAYRELQVTYEGHSEDIPVRVPDISKHGMFVNTARSFPEGAVLNVQFRLMRTGVVVKARGEVRYCLPGVGVGVEFIDITPDDARAIEEEMASNYGSFETTL